MNRNVVILDHYDSFTYNLAVALERLGARVTVLRTDRSLGEIEAVQPTHLVLSPGYGHPQDVLLFKFALEEFQGRLPILGVCLGQQALGLHFGAKIQRCPNIMHGKCSSVQHNGRGIFEGILNPLQVCRYHSLAIDPATIRGSGLSVTAETTDGVIMAVESISYPTVVGVQFHPESYFTESGAELLSNFLSW